MTVRKVWLGSTGPFLYDDSILYIDEDGVISPDNQQAIATDGQIVVQRAPSSPVHVIRKQDLDDALGDIASQEARIDVLEATTAALGTMSTQNANSVVITGGSAVDMSSVGIGTPSPLSILDVVGNTNLRGDLAVDTDKLVVNHLTGRVGIGTNSPGAALHVAGAAIINSSMTVDNTTLVVDSTPHTVGIRRVPRSNITLDIVWPKTPGTAGIYLQQGANDAAADPVVIFANAAGSTAGSITTTATTTAYNTVSDVRLKHDISAMTGALDTMLALNPVSFRWRQDESEGRGFLAHEVEQLVPGVVTGEADAVDESGNVQPQQIDYSKLVPWLTAAMQELVQQVKDLTARIAELEVA